MRNAAAEPNEGSEGSPLKQRQRILTLVTDAVAPPRADYGSEP